MRRIGVLLLSALVVMVGCQPSVESSPRVGTVTKPASVLGRDVGISVNIAGQVTWLMGDTIFDPPACDGTNLRSSTAGIDIPDGVIGNLREPLDACGAPAALMRPEVPPTPTGARTAFWPDSIVPTLDGRAAVFYQRVLIAGDTLTSQATSVDEIRGGATTMDRTNEKVLFSEGERSFVSGGLVAGGFIYLYASENLPEFRSVYYVARVPHGLYRQRSAFTFWDGTAWSPDAARAARVTLGGTGPEGSGGHGGLTVSYNPHLRSYLMVHSQVFSHDLMLRTAASPEGPWSPPTHVDVPDASGFWNYSAREHPEFRSADGKTIYVTYFRTTGWLRGELPVIEIVLR